MKEVVDDVLLEGEAEFVGSITRCYILCTRQLLPGELPMPEVPASLLQNASGPLPQRAWQT